MFDVFIREAGARFGLGDKALAVTQMLLADMTGKDAGGLAGFLDRFKTAGCGPIIQSWLGGGPSAQPIGNSQIEAVLGASDGLLSKITSLLDVNRDHVTTAIAYLLPAIVGRLTPGGSLPSSLPAEVLGLASAGQELLASAATPAVSATTGGGLLKWLPWAIVAAAALIGVTYWGKERTAVQAPTAPASAATPASTEPQPKASVDAASQPLAVGSAPGAAGPASADEPAGAAVVGGIHANTLPTVRVYFDSGKTEVPGDFGAQAADLVAYVKRHDGVKAVISGFSDPTGNAAANVELAKQRAQTVQTALAAAGVPQDRIVLEKPAETHEAAATSAALRRVEVTLRQ